MGGRGAAGVHDHTDLMLGRMGKGTVRAWQQGWDWHLKCDAPETHPRAGSV